MDDIESVEGESVMGREAALPGLEKYTPEQMFFIGFGQLWCGTSRDEALLHSILNDPHSPGQFRYMYIYI